MAAAQAALATSLGLNEGILLRASCRSSLMAPPSPECSSVARAHIKLASSCVLKPGRQRQAAVSRALVNAASRCPSVASAQAVFDTD